MDLVVQTCTGHFETDWKEGSAGFYSTVTLIQLSPLSLGLASVPFVVHYLTTDWLNLMQL